MPNVNYAVFTLVKHQAFKKLVMLEWSGSKSDDKYGISMLKNPPVQIFGAIRATSCV